MTSLGEVYERKRSGGHATPRRVFAGVVLFILGAIMLVVGLVIASTEVLSAWGVGRYESRRIAGVLGGLGLPAVFVGILAVLPASRRVRGAAAIGAAVAIVGVGLFWSVYPSQWLGAGVDRHYTFETATIYFFGTLVTFWCFFVAVVNFKTRNDPGGTVELEVTTAGETKIVEVDRNAIRSGLGGIGFFDSGPDPEPSPTPTVSDGGHETGSSVSSDDEGGVDVFKDEPSRPPSVDRYCGNCTHFEYRGVDGMEPYCGYHNESMSDMQACDQWSGNAREGAASSAYGD